MLATDSVESAKAAKLRYARDTSPGITRRRQGKGWKFFYPDGRVVRDKSELQRIASLVIPPAWDRVWINPLADGHLQAVGYDARGRKQYRYHPKYSEIRNQTKFARLTDFANRLPSIRKQVQSELRRSGLTRERVLATVVRLLETTYIRIGNEEYARENKSFGLTTLKNRHVAVEGATIKFHFRGKSGQDHEVEVHDRRLAAIVRNCHDLPGCELFQYIDEQGERHCVNSEDVNDYIRSIAGDDFSAKDFRTWGGTFLAAKQLIQMGKADSQKAAKSNVTHVVKAVASSLGNRPATCRKYYIYPAVLDAYATGKLFDCVEPGIAPDEVCVRKLLNKLEVQRPARR